MNAVTCAKCDQVVPGDQMYTAKECRECKNARQRVWRAANRERLLVARREDYAAHAVLYRERTRRWRENNRESRQASWKKWYEAHREDRLEYHRTYRAANPEYFQERERARYRKDPHLRARRLIQARVQQGRMPPASELACRDCGGPASEYDHYLGYDKPYDAMVDAVCAPCHLQRTTSRKAVH